MCVCVSVCVCVCVCVHLSILSSICRTACLIGAAVICVISAGLQLGYLRQVLGIIAQRPGSCMFVVDKDCCLLARSGDSLTASYTFS